MRENLRTASDRRDPLAYLADLVWPRRTRARRRRRSRRSASSAWRATSTASPTSCPTVAAGWWRSRVRSRPDRRSCCSTSRRPASTTPRRPSSAGCCVGSRDDWGLAVLLVEHDVSLVLGVCDRVTVLDNGRHLASGTPDEISADPGGRGCVPGRARRGDRSRRHDAGAGPRRHRRGGTACRTRRRCGRPVIEARRLSAGYGDLAAVRELDLDVAPGEIVALLGPNGAGKTTTLLTLAGELAATRRRGALPRLDRRRSRCTSGPGGAWRSCPRSGR